MDKTFVLIKPDGVSRNLVGEIMKRFESRSFKLISCRLERLSRENAEKLYQPHGKKPFFMGLVDFVTSGPSLLMVWQGEGVVERIRNLVGDTDPMKSPLGTLRSEFGINVTKNAVHCSKDKQAAGEEIGIFFAAGETPIESPPKAESKENWRDKVPVI